MQVVMDLPHARQLARTGKELSREARARLDWMDYHRRCQNVALTCRHFGISRQILGTESPRRRTTPYDLFLPIPDQHYIRVRMPADQREPLAVGRPLERVN